MAKCIGIDNIGCSCYINTALQCLYSDPTFDSFLMNAIENKNNIQNALAPLLRQDGIQQNIRPLVRVLHKKIGKYMNLNMQNDMQEFLLLLLDELDKELEKQPSKKQKPHQLNQSQTFHSFLKKEWVRNHFMGITALSDRIYGQTVSQIKCPACSKMFHNAENFCTLTLDLPTESKTHELLDLVANYFKGDTVSDWKCDACGTTHTQVQKDIKLTRVPKVLMITLKRFDQGLFSKNSSQVEIVENFTLTTPICLTREQHKYELTGVGCHMGCGLGGHYYAVVKDQGGEWYTVDDEAVSKASGVDGCAAYMLFYSLLAAS